LASRLLSAIESDWNQSGDTSARKISAEAAHYLGTLNSSAGLFRFIRASACEFFQSFIVSSKIIATHIGA
jgi:hypothetical protein